QPFAMMYEVEGHEGHYLTYFDPLEGPPVMASAPDRPVEPTTATETRTEPNGSADRTAGAAPDARAGDATAEAPPSGLAGERPAEAAGAGGADRTDSTSAAAGAVAAPGIATDGRPAGAPANATRPQPTPGLQLDFGSTEEESELARTIATTDWS